MQLIFSKASTQTSREDIVTRKGNGGQVDNSSTRAFCWLGHPQGFPKLADDRTVSVRDVCFEIPFQSMPIDERFLCGYRLVDTNRYQLTNFIDWYQLIAWFSDHRFPLIGFPGIYLFIFCSFWQVLRGVYIHVLMTEEIYNNTTCWNISQDIDNATFPLLRIRLWTAFRVARAQESSKD